MFTVIINNYNYSKFIAECIESVLAQTYHDFQLIIVDDGSSDNSCSIIESFDDPRILVIKKENGGQLSCFHAALPHIKNEIVTFLDADDIYKEDYLEKLFELYNDSIDSVFVHCEKFGSVNGIEVQSIESFHLNSTKYLTYFNRSWIGNSTSALSMRKAVLDKILPLKDLEQDWRLRADDILFWGIGLVGASKFFYNEPLVGYRVHGNNGFAGRVQTEEALKLRKEYMNRFFAKFQYIEGEATYFKILGEYRRSNLPIRFYYKALSKKRIPLYRVIRCFFRRFEKNKIPATHPKLKHA